MLLISKSNAEIWNIFVKHKSTANLFYNNELSHLYYGKYEIKLLFIKKKVLRISLKITRTFTSESLSTFLKIKPTINICQKYIIFVIFTRKKLNIFVSTADDGIYREKAVEDNALEYTISMKKLSKQRNRGS